MPMRATEILLWQKEAEEKGKCLGLAREAMFVMADKISLSSQIGFPHCFLPSQQKKGAWEG